MMKQSKRLYSPAVIKEIIERHGFKFSKSLGQNFLIDGNIIHKIIEESSIKKSDGIIEIGPGIGTLTQSLCEAAGKVIAIELDNKLLPILEETLKEYHNLEIIHKDVLKVDINRLIGEKLRDMEVKVVANLPYYITTPIIMKLLEEKLCIEKIVVMVQKEVALRMKASPGNKDYGALSVAVQYYSKPEIVVDVPKNVFMPRPNVDSAVIMLDVYKEPVVKVKDEKIFFGVIKAAFGQRRKTLLNALNSGIDLNKEDIEKLLEKTGIEPKRRGETLDINEFARISDEIYEMINNY